MYTTYIFFTDEKRFTIMTWWGKTLPVSKWVRNVVAELTKKVPVAEELVASKVYSTYEKDGSL